jgi:putative transposase
MISFINDNREVYGVEPICRVLPVAPSTYHVHAARLADPAKLPGRAKSDTDIKPKIQQVFDDNYQVYGARKVWRQLKRDGVDVARCTVERLMRCLGLKGAIRGKLIKTTFSDKATPCPLDKVNRQFVADAPNKLWVAETKFGVANLPMSPHGQVLFMWPS